jgi:N-acetylmuramate 1-kinase
MTRKGLIDRFLAAQGFGEARSEPLAQDASFRRYLRLTRQQAGEPRRAVLMDAPPPEDVGPFLEIAGRLARAGLSVPQIIGVDRTAGLLLEEDLGDDLLSSLADDADRRILFDAAVDALVAMQRGASESGLPQWGPVQMRDTALGTLFDWWWPATFGSEAPDQARHDVAGALDDMLSALSAGPSCLVHRDWFAGNLLWLPDRDDARRIGIIDFQGASIGHPAYDLASLLQDARQDVPPPIADRALDRYLDARPELDRAAFRLAFDACAAQRHLRVACQWVRLAQRDHRPQYLAHGPRTWRLLEASLRTPAAAPLAAALDRWIPTERRGNPPGLAE